MMARYRCASCHYVYDRNSRKEWIKSFCGNNGQWTRLMRIRRLRRRAA